MPNKDWTVAEPIDLGEQLSPWSKYKREMNSRLVVACNGGAGCVLYAIGSCWAAWHEGSGSYRLDDNGLDNAPDGISIWEGRMHSWGPDRDGEYDAELRGEFRDPTEDEWKLITKGKAPWDEKEWELTWEDVKDWEIWNKDDLELTLLPANHPQKDFLTKGATRIKEFQAESYEAAKKIYDEVMCQPRLVTQ